MCCTGTDSLWATDADGFKAKRNFHIIKFRTFQKYEMYENKYRTKSCDFTVFFYFFRHLLRFQLVLWPLCLGPQDANLTKNTVESVFFVQNFV